MPKKIFVLFSIILFSVPIYSQSSHSLITANGTVWKVFPVDQVTVPVPDLSVPGFDMSGWISATVPGTFFVDYVNAGLEKDPDFGDNIYQVDEAKYNKAFWYRTEFEIPAGFNQGKLWLNFKGVNKEGFFFLNGEELGTVKGFMLRSKYDVTDKIKNGKNVLLVKIDVPDVRLKREPAWQLDTWANFAMPSFMASAGWDWMPYVPGLNCGITNDVYLTTTGSVVLEDVWIRSDLPDINQAHVNIEMVVKNTGNEPISGTLNGTIMPGNIRISKTVSIGANMSETVRMNKDEFNQLTIDNPLLWWPNGYGKPNLYACNLELVIDDKISDRQTVSFGIRRFDCKTENGAFTLYVNHSKVLMRGGNWGMTEYLQRSRGEEYETRIKLHADMNFNMIRLWTGCVTDDEFYDYCDQYGIMVWDDFWFHGSLFAPDQDIFMSNAIDKIKRLRNHACIAVWCGSNEGVPGGKKGEGLDLALKEAVRNYDGNDRHYQTSSNAGGGLSGSGWWVNQHPSTYFSGPGNGGGDWNGAGTWALRTEIGTATFTTFESFREFMPQDSWWPAGNEMWNKHYFGNQAQTAGTDTYLNTVNENYGTAKEIDEFCEKSQYLNLEVMKAIFEGWSDNMWDNATGVLIWMSQSAYPSFVWQTYDYYYDATGAYWGAKKACEPLHIQWSYSDNSVKVINTTLNDYSDLKAKATVYNLKGEVYEPLGKEKRIQSLSNTATEAFVLADATEQNLALNKPVIASPNANDGEGIPSRAVDGSLSSRWGSGYQNDAWFYVDLETPAEINKVKIHWEGAYGRKFMIQVSDDAINWTTVFIQENGKGGTEVISFEPVSTRYVKFQGIERGTMWGYSFYEFIVYPAAGNSEPGNNVQLSDVNFIHLELSDNAGNLVSDNFYWRNMNQYNYQALNTLPLADVSVAETQKREHGKCHISCVVTNHSSTVAFGNRLNVINKETEKRILPVFMNDNYFTLMPNESKHIEIEFKESLVGNADFEVVLKQYGDYDSSPLSSIKEPVDSFPAESLQIYPNPVSEVLKLNLSHGTLQEVKIYHVSGKLVYSGNSDSTIPVSHFSKGVYLLRAIIDNQSYSTKFVKK